jgi:ankyrin repeat protein
VHHCDQVSSLIALSFITFSKDCHPEELFASRQSILLSRNQRAATMSITVAQKFRLRVHRAADELGPGHVHRERPALAQWLRIVELAQLQHCHSLSSSGNARPPSQSITGRPSRGQRQLSNEAAVAGEIPVVDHQRRRKILMKKFCNIWSSFFESELYQAWRGGSQWYLCCHGEPRCGKSTLAAAVADDLAKFYADNDAFVIALFLDERDKRRRKRIFEMPEINPLAALRFHILKQLVESREAAHGMSTTDASASWHRWIMPHIAQGLSDLLDAEIQRLSKDQKIKLFFIVDGLDSCPPEVETAYLGELTRLQGMILVTRGQPMSETDLRNCDVTDCESRATSLYFRCHECEPLLPFDICLPCHRGGYACPEHGSTFREPYKDRGFELRTIDEEIALYVHEQIKRELLSIPIGQQLSQSHDLLAEIEKTIITRANGVLVIAHAWVDHLMTARSVHELLDTLSHVAKPEQDYFEALLRRVERQAETDRALAQLSLQLVTRAMCEARRRSITYMELVAALTLLDHNLDSPAHLLRICQNTVGISDVTNQIEPFHGELTIWLRENWLQNQPQVDMAHLCLRSILRSIERLRATQHIYPEAQKCLEGDAFLAYALQSWGHHFAQYRSEEAWAQIMSLMNDESAIVHYCILLCLSDSDAIATLNIWPGCQPIHICAFFGQIDILNRLKGAHRILDVDVVDPTFGRTALIIACQNGHATFVQYLLQLGAKPISLCKRGRSAIIEAIDHENDSIFDILLQAHKWNKTDPLSDDEHKILDEALILASSKENPHFLHNLLEARSIDMAVRLNALSMICLLSGCLETFRCLMNCSELDWNYRNDDGETLLHVAARTSIENLRVVIGCLDKSERLATCRQQKTVAGRTPAMLSLQHLGADAHEALRLLGCTSSQYKMTDKRGRNILHYAAEYDRHGTSLKLLHDEGKSLDVLDNIGWSPLHLACCFCNPVAIAAILESSADVGLVDNNGWTALDVACLYDPADNAGIASLFAPYESCRKLETPPYWSQFRGELDIDVIHLSSVSKQELSAVEPNNQNNLLHWAAVTNDEEKLELLLKDRRIDVNAPNADGHTPLSLHCTSFDGPSVDIVELLLAHGADYHSCKNQATDLLEVALEASCIDVAMIFIEKCDAISSTGVDLQVLLQHAIDADNPSVAEKLLDRGAGIFVHDEFGRLPIQQARQKLCSEQMITVLERYLGRQIETMCQGAPQLFASPDLRSESPPPDAKAGRTSPHQNC